MGNTIGSIIDNNLTSFSPISKKSSWSMPTYWIKLHIEKPGADGSPNNIKIIEKFPIPSYNMTEFQLQYYISAYFLPLSDTQLFYQSPISKAWLMLTASEDFIYSMIKKADKIPIFKLVEIPVNENELSHHEQSMFRRLFSLMTFKQRLEYFIETYKDSCYNECSKMTGGIEIVLTALNEGVLKDPTDYNKENNKSNFLVV